MRKHLTFILILVLLGLLIPACTVNNNFGPTEEPEKTEEAQAPESQYDTVLEAVAADLEDETYGDVGDAIDDTRERSVAYVYASNATLAPTSDTPNLTWVCNGVSDDVEIAAADAAAYKVVLSDGDFSITAELNPSSYRTWEGQGLETVLSCSHTGRIIDIETSATGVKICDMKIDGASKQAYNKEAVAIQGNENTIENVWITGHHKDGLWVDGDDNSIKSVTIADRDTSATQNSGGIYCSRDSERNYLDLCRVYSNTYSQPIVLNGSYNTADRCYASSPRTDNPCIFIPSNDTGSQPIGCAVVNCVANGTNSDVGGETSEGIAVHGGNDHRIFGNLVYNCGVHEFFINGGNNISVNSNTFKGGSTQGVEFHTNSSSGTPVVNITFTGNTIYNAKLSVPVNGRDASFSAGLGGITISSNTFYNGWIFAEGVDDLIISDNFIELTQNGKKGIELETNDSGTPCSNVIVSGNIVTETDGGVTGSVGILLDTNGTDYCQVKDNDVTNVDTPLTLNSGNTNYTIEGNLGYYHLDSWDFTDAGPTLAEINSQYGTPSATNAGMSVDFIDSASSGTKTFHAERTSTDWYTWEITKES